MKTVDSSSVPFDRKTFYGRHRTKTLPVEVRVHRQVKTNLIKRTPTPYRSRIIGPCSSWEVFYRQKDAFDFVHSSASKDVRVWSYESELFVERSGQRMYLAASLPKFWHYYSQLPTNQRHHYEVIPEGGACKLYFDLEYNREHNPGLDGPRMVDIFIQYVCYQLGKVYGIVCCKEDVIQLDASIPTKFSQHLIFCHRDTVFKDTEKAGCFTSYCCLELERILKTFRGEAAPVSEDVRCNHKEAPLMCDCPRSSEIQELSKLGLHVKDLQSLFVFDRDGRKVIFCDKGVYTRNRNFRLYLSCKLGKENPLVVSKANRCTSSCPQTDDEHARIFAESLITKISDLDPDKLLSWNCLGKECTKPGFQRDIGYNHGGKAASAEGTMTKSPYPEVDDFVNTVVSRGGCHGYIRRWAYFSEAELLTYDIFGNRYCHNVGRPHRSNHIMILADLRQGIYYQKCHDPDCRAANYKSDEWPLPRDVLPACILGEDDISLPSPGKPDLKDLWDDDDEDELSSLSDAWLQNISSSSMQDSLTGEAFEREVDDVEDEFLVRAAEIMETSLNQGEQSNTSGEFQENSEFDVDDDDLLAALDSFEESGT